MSRTVRKQYEKTIELLKKLNDSIPKVLERGNIQNGLDILQECQESAIGLGTHMEKVIGTDSRTVRELEEYCENVYQLAELIQSGQEGNDAGYKAIADSFTMVERIFEEEYPDKKEVVFLPYKASMWDSLESVWRAADKEENTIARVIPIPYFERDSDGNFAKEVWEGNEYPKDVPITRYDEYDLDLHHPDEIYIHNPYDEYNYVTSVHPDYYTPELKKCTEKLIYIPYFVLEEINPKNQIEIEPMKHFCFLPGTINADLVILQSEDMKTIYVNEYYKEVLNRGMNETKDSIEKRFVGWGSPKFDKVRSTKKEDVEIPEDWLKRFVRPDGSWKKVILYNNSVSAFLQYKENMLLKIRDVIRVFRERQDDVVMLWRPHPLMKQTIESMYPRLWREYEEIVEKYREESFGIYDDSSDLNRAIAVSDAYFGDRSSVVSLFEKGNKPVMIQAPSLTGLQH